MLINHPLEVEDISNLHLDIHTIGYPEEGETLLTMICDGSHALFTVLTDCYGTNDYNHIHYVMEQSNANRIDAFIWTHPDKDHSVDIPAVLAKYDPDSKAQIFLPSGLNKHMGLSEEAIGGLDYVMKHYNSGKRYEPNYVSLNKGERQQMLMSFRIKVLKSGIDVYCRYNFLLPSASVIARRLNSDADIYLNDLSIFYIVTFNDYNYVFCGDLSEQNVKFIDPDLLENTVFIKIPHHGTDSLKTFIPKLVSKEVKEAVSVTTVFRQHGLPKDYVLADYTSISNAVYCTSNRAIPSVDSYGCITARFYANQPEVGIEMSGNAFCYYHS